MGVSYDGIADSYRHATDERPSFPCVHAPTMVQHLGDLAGLDVIDLGCGSGRFTRLAMALHPRRLVGVDRSAEEIRMACAEAKENGWPIEYVVGDLRDLSDLGEFDIAMAGMVLHDAESKDELFSMCRSAASCLKPGGRLLAILNNPDRPVTEQPEHRIVVRADSLDEGSPIRVTFLDAEGQSQVEVVNYRWTKPTYEEALQAAGFATVAWPPFVISAEGSKRYPAGYWEAYLSKTHLAFLECVRG